MISKQDSFFSRFLPSTKPLLRRGAMVLACSSLFFTLAGCHATPDVGEAVKGSMQSTFDKDPNFVNYHFKVDKVVATKKDDANYDGMATIEFQGQPHQVPVHITVDSSGNADWKTDPNGLGFAAQ